MTKQHTGTVVATICYITDWKNNYARTENHKQPCVVKYLHKW